MKQLFLALLLVPVMTMFGQSTKPYFTSGGEMIFSFASVDNNGSSDGSVLRWSPVFNLQVYGNYDFSKNAGFIFGGALRNVGFIYDVPNSGGQKKKFRNYDIGIPVGIKIGNMNKLFFFGGYEIEFPINYKEKTFIDEKKEKFNVWFSNRVPSYYHSVFAGIQFPYGLSLKFKYYLSEFFNQDYTESDGNQPYQGIKANVFYFSISTSLFKGHDVYIKEYKKESEIY